MTTIQKDRDLTNATTDILLDAVPGWSHAAANDIDVWWSGHGSFEGISIRLASGAVLLAQRLATTNTDAERQRIFLGIDGHFAIVVRFSQGVVLATDRVRSVPLLVGKSGPRFAVGANIHALCRHLTTAVHDSVGVLQFAMAGYTLDDRTLYQDIQNFAAGRMAPHRTQRTIAAGEVVSLPTLARRSGGRSSGVAPTSSCLQ